MIAAWPAAKISNRFVIELLDCSRPAAGKAVRVLEAAGIVRSLDERKKNRTVVFEDYLAHLRQGTELGA